MIYEMPDLYLKNPSEIEAAFQKIPQDKTKLTVGGNSLNNNDFIAALSKIPAHVTSVDLRKTYVRTMDINKPNSLCCTVNKLKEILALLPPTITHVAYDKRDYRLKTDIEKELSPDYSFYFKALAAIKITAITVGIIALVSVAVLASASVLGVGAEVVLAGLLVGAAVMSTAFDLFLLSDAVAREPHSFFSRKSSINRDTSGMAPEVSPQM